MKMLIVNYTHFSHTYILVAEEFNSLTVVWICLIFFILIFLGFVCFQLVNSMKINEIHKNINIVIFFGRENHIDLHLQIFLNFYTVLNIQ